jgi:hypothetical protein
MANGSVTTLSGFSMGAVDAVDIIQVLDALDGARERHRLSGRSCPLRRRPRGTGRRGRTRRNSRSAELPRDREGFYWREDFSLA